MQTLEDHVTIRDVGPVASHTLPVRPGVTILTGANEVGKSTCIQAVSALIGRDAALSVRDGAKKGLVEGMGTTLSVGRKTVRAGELEVDSLEDRLDLASLVDPGLKSPTAANRKRIKALISLTGTQLRIENFFDILPESLKEYIRVEDADEDPVEMARKIKARMEKHARDVEDKAAQIQGKINAAAERLRDVDLSAIPDQAELRRAVTEADREEAKLLERMAAASKAEAARTKAKVQYEQIVAAAGIDLDQLKAAESEAAAKAQSFRENAAEQKEINAGLEREIEALKLKLETGRQRLSTLERGVVLAMDSAESAKRSLEQHAKRLEDAEKFRAMAEAAIPSAPSADELEAADAAKKAAQAAVERGAVLAELAKVAEDQERQKKAKLEAVQLATIFRNAAGATDEVLSAALACETLKVVEGELYYVEGARREAYDRLSDGKRWQVAISEIANTIRKNKAGKLCVIPLQQPAWEGLDAGNRQTVHDAAVEADVCIVTAEKGEGPLSSRCWAETESVVAA